MALRRCATLHGSFYTNGPTKGAPWKAYAADRFVTLLPEVDTPGHGLALLRLHPELRSGRNLVRPGHAHQSAWLDPELPATFAIMDAALAELASLFPGPFLHIGGEEPYGMPDQAYGDYVRRLRRAARALGKRTAGRQESVRAGADPGHVIQYWMDASSLGAGAETPVPPEVRPASPRTTGGRVRIEQAKKNRPIATSKNTRRRRPTPDNESAVTRWASAITRAPHDRGHLRLGSGNSGRHGTGPHRRGRRRAWCETVRDVDDLTFLLLPRLAGTAEKAWGPAGAVTWPEHRDALAQHARLWKQDGLNFFSAART